jgi:uncharacterized protein YqgQ
MVRQCGLGVMQSKLLLVIELMTIETKEVARSGIMAKERYECLG